MEEARAHERSGAIAEAFSCYRDAAEAAGASGDHAIESEVLRRLAVLHHRRNERDTATGLATRSHAIALEIGDSVLAGEALNVLAGFAFERGDMDEARGRFREARALGGTSPGLRGRIEQNLGILANVRGEHGEAFAHYRRSLEGFELSGDQKGCAIAHNNLGMVCADRQLWEEADGHFRRSLDITRAVGEVHLEGLCLLNHSEVHLARQRYDEARASAEQALTIFDRLGSRLDKADAYKVLGVVYRETGRFTLAESRLQTAIEQAVTTSSVLSEAEASRELARLYQAMGRNQEALQLLNAAHRLFSRLDARVDLVDVTSKTTRLEETYFAVVRDWGQSIESADSYTFGHCERVASYAVAVATALGADQGQLTTIRMGAYLHDVGKVKVPHQILNKPGRLTDDEFAVIKRHPVWGVELLAAVEFPWDIKPIIRYHHERYDGTGYPDRLKGDEIPLGAQIICIVDVYDALTTTRSYRGAMSHEQALAEMEASRHWWRPDVYAAFLQSVGSNPQPV
ncbi:MAG TPA: HD domain-containing phosphohydrolase [Methylomirabilota bacterium]